jgi:hypothetical protein
MCRWRAGCSAGADPISVRFQACTVVASHISRSWSSMQIAPSRHVVGRSGEFQAQRSGHAGPLLVAPVKTVCGCNTDQNTSGCQLSDLFKTRLSEAIGKARSQTMPARSDVDRSPIRCSTNPVINSWKSHIGAVTRKGGPEITAC